MEDKTAAETQLDLGSPCVRVEAAFETNTGKCLASARTTWAAAKENNSRVPEGRQPRQEIKVFQNRSCSIELKLIGWDLE